MKKCLVMTGMVAIAAVLAATLSAQVANDDLATKSRDELVALVVDLRAEVATLQQQLDDLQADAEAVGGEMVVEEIIAEPQDPSIATSIKDRQSRIAAKEKERRDLEQQRVKLLNGRDDGSSDAQRRDEAQRRKQREAISASILRLDQDIRKLEGEVKKLERDAWTRYVIRGFAQSTSITLRTTRDCAKVVSLMKPGARVNWSGTRTSVDSNGSETWDVVRLQVLAKTSAAAPATPPKAR